MLRLALRPRGHVRARSHTCSELENDLYSFFVEVAAVATKAHACALDFRTQSSEERLDPIGQVVLLHEDACLLAQARCACLLPLIRLCRFAHNLKLQQEASRQLRCLSLLCTAVAINSTFFK